MTIGITGRPRFEIILGLCLAVITPAAFIWHLRPELGLGLIHKHLHYEAIVPLLPPLRPQAESAFVLNKLVGQPPQTRVYDFTVDLAWGAPDGVPRTMLVVNGMYPGPTIEANQADRLVVHVKNNLPNATSIHWHGLFQNGTNFYDGAVGITECGIPPGQSLTYNFTFGGFSGTTWWHSHSTQYTDGVSGALIVHPTLSPPPEFPSWDEEIVIQMADWYHRMSEDLLVDYLSVCVASPLAYICVQTLNGLGQYDSKGSYFSFTLQPNKTYRLRLINAGSFPSIRFSVDWHPLTLIEADGTMLEPVTVSGITVAVAQRYSVLLHTNATANENGTYWIRTILQDDMFKYKYFSNLNVRAILRYAGAPSLGLPGHPDSPDPGPGVDNALDVDGFTHLRPLIPEPSPEVTKVYTMTMSFQKISDARVLGFMNTTSWEIPRGDTTLLAVARNPKGYAPEGAIIAPVDQLMITEDSIQVVELRIDNLDDGDHPFHLHGLRPWLMGSAPGRYIGQSVDPHPLRRDTFVIPAFSYYIIRFVTDNPGLWAFHCHLVWHMAAGLLMQINSLPSKSAQFDIPQDIISQCAAAK
ncbi:multicopper oxidase 2A [Hysterangium stoloniferum]|nr:multicopper oxidase 2A [Hysterangium stoloniferum]